MIEKDKCSIDFIVKDNGIGIPKEVQTSIFQPFYQADSSVRRKFGGSGLGLNISKRLVDLMNGFIHFESKEGIGSIFSFHIPFNICYGSNASISPPTKRRISIEDNVELSVTNTLPILIAEDNYMNQQVIRRIMKNIGFNNLTIVDNGQKAVDEMKINNYKIILMDCMMPIMSGTIWRENK